MQEQAYLLLMQRLMSLWATPIDVFLLLSALCDAGLE